MNISNYNAIKEFIHVNNINIILVGLCGSRAYGTAIDNNDYHSDYDYRGIYLNSIDELIGIKTDKGQICDTQTDTVIYSFNKLISLLSNCNPNTIEILGLRPQDYIYLSDIGHELVYNASMFLSKRAINSFGGYARSQLRRLDNKSARLVDQTQYEKHILGSIQNAAIDFPRKYFEYTEDSINLYVDKAVNPEMESEIFMDINLHHYPLRDYKCMWSEMHNIAKEYTKIGKRNSNAIEHNKLGKHMMHLVRLFYMCFDILERHEIITYREKEHDFLMDIRNGKFLDDNQQPIPEFFELVDELEKRLDYDKKNTNLPENPNYKLINEFVMDVNKRVVMDL